MTVNLKSLLILVLLAVGWGVVLVSGSAIDGSAADTDVARDVHREESTTLPPVPVSPAVPAVTDPNDASRHDGTGASGAEAEHRSSLTIFFILVIIGICILMIHVLLVTKFHYLPDSVAVVFLGALIGMVVKLLHKASVVNWQDEEAFPPTTFFLVFLPPIIFESGYNLHKGNFFQNIGSILIFAIIGTTLSAIVIGGGIFFLGMAGVVYELSLAESFAFGSLVSAVDPIATLAIFQAMDMDPVLYMLVFGESILNDAVSIVLTTTILELAAPGSSANGGEAFAHILARFMLMFFASALIGTALALVSALLLKCIDLRRTPSLEFAMMLVFMYTPYALAESLKLSGIMAILFAGIVMSHYTHHNLSPVTQVTVQQTFRTLAFLAETCVFAYLGLAIFSFNHLFKASFVIWSIAMCLLSRAFNIFPLSFLLNYFREHKITKKMQFIMWFSGLRGAIAFALALQINFTGEHAEEKRRVLVTTTLLVVLFTILFLGGSTMPMMKLLKAERRHHRKMKEISLSKTMELGEAIDSEPGASEAVGDESDVRIVHKPLHGFLRLDANYVFPFLTRRLSAKELHDDKIQLRKLTTGQWSNELRDEESEHTRLRASQSSSEDDVQFDRAETVLQ